MTVQGRGRATNTPNPVVIRPSVPSAAVSSGATQLAYAGPASVLGAAAGGTDLRLIASFTNKLTYTMIARPEIKRPEDLRGKRFGVQAIGGSVWMGAV